MKENLDSYWDPSKKGTVIVSSYRSGTHFLYDNLCSHLRKKNIQISPIQEVDDLHWVSNSKPYTIAILNSSTPKIPLVKDQDQLNDWHIVRLTRNNKIEHWISHYVWQYHNSTEQRFNNTNLPHHGGTQEKYKNIPQVKFDTGLLEPWLLEQFLINLFSANITLDYTDLPLINDTSFKWSPNDYGLDLSQLFSNSNEIHSILKDYSVPKV